jgi:hypothetical protein
VINVLSTGHELSLANLREQGFLVPTLIQQQQGLDLRLPENANADYVVSRLG